MMTSMLRRAALLMVLFAMSSFSVYAEEVTAADALQKAQDFANSHFARKGGAPKSKPASQIKAIGQVSGLYVFGLSDAGGFVIVSNDDRTVPIVGYSDNGTIDPNNMPDGLRYMLDGYKEQIALLGDTEVPGRANRVSAGDPVEPLITTRWGQSTPYNNYCPEIDGDRTLTGCVATTVAQLMYYHYCKGFSAAASTAIPGYSFTAKNKAKEEFTMKVTGLSATSFNWAAMTTTYTSSSTGESADAVAKLMQYAGTSLFMMYGLNSSEAYSEDIPYALKTYFGFDGGIQHCYRKNYSYDAWVSLIYSELAAGRPVALGGQCSGGGHSFICDGYKYENEADYFSINWGWGGGGNGYFLLSLLSPYKNGYCGLSRDDGFSWGQDAVIGIQPPVDNNPDYCLSLEGLHLGGSDEILSSKTFTREASTDSFTGISLYYKVYNYYRGGSHTFDTTVQLVDASGNLIQTLGENAVNQTKNWNETIEVTLNDLSIPSGIGNGTYYIKVMSRPHGESNWQECFDGDAYKMTATISGNNLTINVPIPANIIPTATLSITGDHMTGHEYIATATITGGTGPYNGDIVLRVNGTAIVGKTLNVGAGKNVVMEFPFIPIHSGVNTVALYTSRTGGTPIISEDISVSFVIDNSKENYYIIEDNDGKTVSATLYGRKLYKDGDWNTICLPFNVTDGDNTDELTFSDTPLEGAEARTLTESAFSNGSLTLNFSDPVATLEAGKPYIIRWDKAVDYKDDDAHNIVDPVFNSVKIDKTYRDVTTTTYVDFLGVYNYHFIKEDNHSVLLVGANNKLFWPQENASLGACRAYFKLKNGLTAGEVAAARMNFDEGTQTVMGHTEITEITEKADAAWYTLDGRKIDGKPTQKGLYIYKGIKRVVK
ncbi:C10 family peptidase [uncultured Prevotella sp.]|uniref:C10 family peptidase n=1 Tax=uncultured Prevotella sp. TaxID=159272 RepID=UPI0025F79552|nr:C10 family peptidase [uncultured Prevotella sp.]